MQPDACRILDANANRAVEGMRVVEDYLRFALNRVDLCQAYKQMRHQLRDILAPWQPALCAARDTPGDVGTEVSTASESRRDSTADVARASQARIQQALRCLEEYLKIESAEAGRKCESLRYTAYMLGQQWDGGAAQSRLRNAQLCVLIGAAGSRDHFRRLASELIEAGVDMLQLRDKDASQRALLEFGETLRELTTGTPTLMIVNDHPGIARLVEADGVHVGQDDLPLAAARRAAAAPLVGVSTHNLSQAREASEAGAAYLGCGPTFASHTKAFHEFPGLPFLREVAQSIPTPAFAIGGIDAKNLSQVVATGVRRVAVSHAVAQADQPGRAARELSRILKES